MSTSPYEKYYKDILLDPYRIIEIYGITSAPQQHALKKLLRAGQSHKELRQDINETIQTLQRWLQMLDEDNPEHGAEPDTARKAPITHDIPNPQKPPGSQKNPLRFGYVQERDWFLPKGSAVALQYARSKEKADALAWDAGLVVGWTSRPMSYEGFTFDEPLNLSEKDTSISDKNTASKEDPFGE